MGALVLKTVSGRFAIGSFAPSFVAGLALLALAFVQAQNVARASFGPDFYHYWLVPRVMGAASASVYEPAARREIARAQLAAAQSDRASPGRARAAGWNAREYPDGIAPTGTPFFYAALAPLVAGDYDRALARYQLVANLAFFAGLLALCHALGFPPLFAGALGVLFSVWFEPFVADVRFGNANRLVFAGVALYLGLLASAGARRGAFAAGAWLGALVLFKPTVFPIPFLVSLLWLAEARYARCAAHALGFGAGALAALVLGSLAFAGLETWPAWVASLERFGASSRPDAAMLNNSSAARLLLERTGHDFSWLLAGGFAIGAGAWLWRVRARRAGSSPFAAEAHATGVACALPLIAAPIAWLHYSVLAIPLLLHAARPPEPPGSLRAATIGGIAVAVAAGFSLANVLASAPGPGARSSNAIAANALLLAALALSGWRLREESRAPAAPAER